MTPLRFLIAGGGTGGHVIPALAIARELRHRHGAEVRFLGTARGLESRLVPEAGFALELIRVGQLKGVSLSTRTRTLADLPLGLVRCRQLLRDFRPHAVVGVGGYASGPGMMAAILLRIPTLAFEPNAVPGLANRLVGKRVSAAAVNFEETKAYFRGAELTGIPVRQEFFQIQARAGTAAEGKRLLVFGGSQGARVFNEAVPGIVAAMMLRVPGLTVLHQTGVSGEVVTRERYQRMGVEAGRWEVQAYLDGMARRFAEADVILCRSGASTLAELAAGGRGALLVPFAAAADDHQRKNAEVFARAGAAAMMLESEMTPHALEAKLFQMLGDEEGLRGMGERAREFARPDAVARIGEMVVGLATRKA